MDRRSVLRTGLAGATVTLLGALSRPQTAAAALGPPAGSSTAGVPRPPLGNVPYGSIIYSPTVPGTAAIIFEQGPYIYTPQLLDTLKDKKAKATFAICGNNLDKGAIDDPGRPWPDVIKRVSDAGHQLANNTWDHFDLSTLPESDRRNQLYQVEMALRNIIGKFPTYMWPPYDSANADVLATLDALGYHGLSANLDTDAYDSANDIQKSMDIVSTAVNASDPERDSFFIRMDEILETTVTKLVPFAIDTLKTKGYRLTTVGEALADPAENWYRSAS